MLLLRKLYSTANLYSDDVIDDFITIRGNRNFYLRLFVKGATLHLVSNVPPRTQGQTGKFFSIIYKTLLLNP
jgi:hypothetical protein